jgi:hypothetical protein
MVARICLRPCQASRVHTGPVEIQEGEELRRKEQRSFSFGTRRFRTVGKCGGKFMIARVFPRKTNATPDDAYAFIGKPNLSALPEDITEVYISVAFTWDLPIAENLAEVWSTVAPVKIGGPATGMRGEEFTPGFFLKHGYLVTSRGCPNRCWFCGVPAREGNTVRELPVQVGRNILDDNFLACSEAHIRKVFAMLNQQKRGTVQFTGGLEAARLESWHVELLKELRPKQIFFAFDTADDLPALEEAARLFKVAEYGTRNNLRCYVLVGYPGDSFQEAEHRLRTVMRLRFCPMAMLYRDHTGVRDTEWRKFQCVWARPAIIYSLQNRKAV